VNLITQYPFHSKGLNDNGFVLAYVLWIITVLISLAIIFILSERLNTKATFTLKAQAIVRAEALKAFAEALSYLSSDKDPQVDFVDEKGLLHIDNKTPPMPSTIEYEHTKIRIRIEDELSKININYASSVLLQRLLTRLGYNPDEISVMIDSLNDWKDLDSLHRLQGAEQEYYEPLGYAPKNSLLDNIAELTLIRGFGPKVLFGNSEHPALATHITVFGKGGLNVNTASEETLMLIGLSQTEINSIIQARKTGGLRFLTADMLQAGLNRTSSDTFRIEITAWLKSQPGVGYNIISVVRRLPYKKTYKSNIVYWKENALYTDSG